MKVSISVITYNHEAYIRQALDSVLQQHTSFDKEIVIGEDFSKDVTRAICLEYAEKYPGIVKVIPADKNVGMLPNFDRTWRACTGDYIAFIEGDDYWIDPHKLQKQVDFLEANKDFSGCFHNVIIKSERTGQVKEWIMHKDLEKDTFDTGDVLGPWFIASPSFVFRNYPDFELPDWFYNCRYGDLPFMLLLSLRGNFKYIDEVMAVYRLHNNGMTAKDIEYDKIILMVYIYESFNIHTNYRFRQKVREAEVYEISRHLPKDLIAVAKRNGKANLPYKVLSKVKTIFK